MNSVEKVKEICKGRGIPISRLEKDLGFSNGYIGQLRKGTFPNDRLVRISEYLDIPIEYFLDENRDDALSSKDLKDIAKDMENIRRKLMNSEDGPASYDGTAIPEADAELLLGQIELMMKRLKPINKEKYNPNKNKK